MKHKILFSALSLLAVAPMTAQTTYTDADLANAYSPVTYNARVSVHDPSVVVDNITNPSSPAYYIYGSHLGRGKTTQAVNYRDWTTFASGEENDGTENSLFADENGKLINWSDAYGAAHDWQASGNTVKGMQWAPDIIYNPKMKKWCMYMSLNGDNWCSSIVLFTADSPEGPWTNKGIVIYSGFCGRFNHNGYAAADDWKYTDLDKAIPGTTTLPERYAIASNQNYGSFWPNAIDPCVFFDEAGNLWMSYGSWSGGIFEIKLDAATGLRDYNHTYAYEENGVAATPAGPNEACTSDPYFGKKIAGGYYVSGEGSYIKKIGDYYFLFVSYGGLNPSQGYQMRVFRSTSPNGPFVDPDGNSALYTGYALNYGANATDNRGVLLMEGYQWDPMPNGEVAQGHNSAFIDDKSRTFVVYHTKFNDGTFGHQVRVHQLFLNEDGWLVAAPYEFNGETANDNTIATTASIDDANIPGDYQFIRHEYDQSHEAVADDNQATKAELETPVNIHLTADGKITGVGITRGSWARKAGTDFITLSINGVDYKGVLTNQTIDYTNIPALTIAAVSDGNGSRSIGQTTYTRNEEVWASKADTKGAIKYTLDNLGLEYGDSDLVNTDLDLPEKGLLGTTIKWTSSNDSIFNAEYGEITGKGYVTLSMNISKDGASYTKNYTVEVDRDGVVGTPTYYPESQQKDLTAAWWTNFSNEYYTLKNGKSAKFRFYNYSSKANNWDNWCLAAANGERGSNGYAEYFVLRNDNFGWGDSYNADGLSSEYNWDTFKDDMDSSLVDMTVTLNNDTIVMNSVITTKAGKILNYGYTGALPTGTDNVTLFFVNEQSYIDGSVAPKTPYYYPSSEQQDNEAAWWTNFSTDYYKIPAGTDARFKFYNFSDTLNNWDNWVMAVANGERGTDGYAEYYVLRNDNFGWGDAYDANGLTSDYDWTTFKQDMDSSFVDMTIAYGTDGKIDMNATITTLAGKVYHYAYTTTLSAKPEDVTVFFVNEKSHISGANTTRIDHGTATGISKINAEPMRFNENAPMYNLAGQRVGKSYHGIVIQNGRKFFNK